MKWTVTFFAAAVALAVASAVPADPLDESLAELQSIS